MSLLNADARHIPLADRTVQCVVTSPPYWGLRDYGTARWEGGDPDCDHRMKNPEVDHRTSTLGPNRSGLDIGNAAYQHGKAYRDICGKCGARRIDQQIGLEQTPDAYVAELVAVFREVRRVLKDDGVLWLNLGDSYAGGGGFSAGAPSNVASKSGKYGELGALKAGGIKPQGASRSRCRPMVGTCAAIASGTSPTRCRSRSPTGRRRRTSTCSY
jgi:hypothetical protein